MRGRGVLAVLLVIGTLASCSRTPASGSSAGSGSRSPSVTAEPSPSGPSPAPTAAPMRPRAVPAPALRVDAPGTGEFVVVPGHEKAPGRGSVRTVRLEIEGGVPVDPATFADFVMDTLNDPRSWGHGGTMTFARISGSAQIVVRLASPETSAALCRPLITAGRLSCSEGQYAILTSYRWFSGQSEFDSLTQYRHYVVNHEVGHVLGHGHVPCPGPGQLAPVMQQQTKRVTPCKPNAWPFP